MLARSSSSAVRVGRLLTTACVAPVLRATATASLSALPRRRLPCPSISSLRALPLRSFTSPVTAEPVISRAEAERMVAGSRLSPGVHRVSQLIMRSAHGSWVSTADGQRFLDFTAGIGVVSTGHSHPHVVAAVQRQAAQLVHAQVSIAYSEPQLKLAEKLAPLMPRATGLAAATTPPLDTFFFWNSGTEAVEAAMKLARQATAKPNIIVMQGGYHGRTYGAMSLTTSKTIYRAGQGPLPSGVYVAPFPYGSQLPHAIQASPAAQAEYAINQLELLLKQQTAPSETAAVILEPVLGEGGYVVPPDGYMSSLRSLCDRHNLLLVADEVQSGSGRTGRMWAVEHWGIQPDILIFAKGIASGYPLSGIAANKKLMAKQPAGSMGGTYAGNAVSCAAAIATLEVFERENVLNNVVQRGTQLTRRLNDMKRDSKIASGRAGGIQEVRGLGLMQAIQFSDKAPKGFANTVAQLCQDRGLLILTTSVFETIRVIPSLTVSAEEIDQACDILHAAIVTAEKQFAGEKKRLY